MQKYNYQINKTLIFDPIPFKGGSKIATSDALNICSKDANSFVIATADPSFWQSSEFYAKHQVTVHQLVLLPWLTRQHHGIGYWLTQLYLTAVLLKIIMLYGNINQVIGASGPGIDMPLYLLKAALKIKLIQWVHGDVACSRSIGLCLTKADAVFYLASAKPSIKAALNAYLSHATKIADSNAAAQHYLDADNYHEFVNGIAASRWPKPSQTDVPVCFWAASLLKWKGLDTLIAATKLAKKEQSEKAQQQKQALTLNICFIRPVDTCLDASLAPVVLPNTHWFEDPHNLDEIRQQSNIFISTSHNEPFGLSILEALASGMCVIIPQDGAFWDKTLTHNHNCIKYQAGNSQALCDALLYAISQREVFHRCCNHAIEIAAHYRAEHCYQGFAKALL